VEVGSRNAEVGSDGKSEFGMRKWEMNEVGSERKREVNGSGKSECGSGKGVRDAGFVLLYLYLK